MDTNSIIIIFGLIGNFIAILGGAIKISISIEKRFMEIEKDSHNVHKSISYIINKIELWEREHG